MLHEFLIAKREGILALCAKKILQISAEKPSSNEIESGLPIFYDELIEVLRADEEESVDQAASVPENIHRDSAIRRGKESLRLGYTVSQVVHGYGSLCQAITEYVDTHHEPIQPREFNRLNYCLDIAISEAITEFSKGQRDNSAHDEVQRLGLLAHEMRNALGHAAMAHQMIKKGIVGFGGSTSQILQNALTKMKDIIDRSLTDVRLRGEAVAERTRCRVIDLVGEVETTSTLEASARSIQLHIDVAPELLIDADRHLVVSAISNLVQNAIKFTSPNGNVWIRSKAISDRVLIEVEDECGGLPPGKIEELFRPFIQKGMDRSGVGLGLSITRRAIAMNSGNVSVRDLPGKGCIFIIDLPQSSPISGEAEDLSASIH